MNKAPTPKVSIVIPAYNAMAFLPETVESVFRQTFTEFELIIVNDGSRDHIAEWVNDIDDPRLRFISQHNQGASVARNTGILNARGEYISFLDADDVWAPTKLEKQVHCLETNPKAGLVYTWLNFADKSAKPTERLHQPTAEGNVFEKIIQSDLIMSGSVPVVRRHCFKAVGLFDPELAITQDLDMWIRLAARFPFALIKEPLVYYRRHSNSISTNCQQQEKDFFKMMDKVFATHPRYAHLKNKVYGTHYRYLAWRSIESRNYNAAARYIKRGLQHYPQMLFAKNSRHLLKLLLISYSRRLRALAFSS